MAYSNLFLIPHSYPSGPDLTNYYKTREQSFMPFGYSGPWVVDKSTVLSGYDRAGNLLELYSTDIDVTQHQRTGVWQGDERLQGFASTVDVSLAHAVGTALGTLTGSSDEVMAMSASPIRNFMGISFKWNTNGSYWTNSGYRIKPENSTHPERVGKGVFLSCFNAETGKITWQRAWKNSERVGQDPEASEITNNDNTNIVWFTFTEDDQNWVRTNPIYLIGVGIQLQTTSIGGMSRYRQFNIWDTQVVYSTPMTSGNNQPMSQILFDRTDKGIGNHCGRFYAPSKIFTF